MGKYRRGLHKLNLVLKENIYNLLKIDIQVWDSVLDVGCSGLLNLFDFEFTPFKTLCGIDKERLPSDSIAYYDEHRRKHVSSKGEDYTMTEEEVQQAYESRFHFSRKDITTWVPDENAYRESLLTGFSK